MTATELGQLEDHCLQWLRDNGYTEQSGLELARELHDFALYLADATFAGAWDGRWQEGYNQAVEDE